MSARPANGSAAHASIARGGLLGGGLLSRGLRGRARDAILAAARFLADHGAVGTISSALYAYNPRWRYVDAVLRYARRLRADPHALLGYYHRQVVLRLARGWFLLPPGYGIKPAVRPIRLRI